MDRVSGVYKRKSQIFVGIIAVVVTLVANVDTLQVANSLSHDKAVRDSLVAAAPELARNAEASDAENKSSTGTADKGTADKGTTKGNASASGGSASASTTPEPSISSIKASLDELNKLGLPIGYVRVCTALEESVVDSCVTETAANEAKAKLDTAQTNADNGEKALQSADDSVKAAEKKLSGSSNDADKTANQKELDTAKAKFDTAKTARDNAATELTNAQKVQAKAAAKVKEINAVKEAFARAEADLKKAPDDAQLQQAYHEAGVRMAFTTKCPKCQRESKLTDDELKRRLPTTHDYRLFSGDFRSAVGALVGDALNLLYSHWFGWLITAFAISLGAPFWFDTLNRIMVIRSTVKPHEKSKEQESKDNPDEDDKKKT